MNINPRNTLERTISESLELMNNFFFLRVTDDIDFFPCLSIRWEKRVIEAKL